jgi:hypothetical protein
MTGIILNIPQEQLSHCGLVPLVSPHSPCTKASPQPASLLLPLQPLCRSLLHLLQALTQC